MPDHVRTADAALVEPLCCAVRGHVVLRDTLGARVLVYGAGTMGLMMLQLARRTGVVSVDVVDTNAARLHVQPAHDSAHHTAQNGNPTP